MADIKLFQIHSDSARELPAESVDVEKSLQSLMEQHLESFLGVRFLATEYVTGKEHSGRIDTLGLDDNDRARRQTPCGEGTPVAACDVQLSDDVHS